MERFKDGFEKGLDAVTMEKAMTLLQLSRHLSALVAVPSTQNVWVTAELSDVAERGGHCYMELLEKDTAGATVARMRGIIWAGNYHRLMAQFYSATGQRFVSGIKLMVCGSATLHPVYGLSLVITAINPEYTLGDLMRRRREILSRLKAEGILDMNRELPWPAAPLRVAVISAPGAAGYGDFINQLYHNDHRLRFAVKLFTSLMQGEKAPASIIAALEEVAGCMDDWDCVVIIRGGGATSDLATFDDYDLAANIAQFPLPVIVGIGHERDTTVLDYVANMRVKTPTAAAQWLIGRGAQQLTLLADIASTMLRVASDRMAGAKEQLSYYSGLLPAAAPGTLDRASARLRNAVSLTLTLSSRRILPAMARLQNLADNLPAIAARALSAHRDKINASARLLDALSPQATLRRGYSITRVDGVILTSASTVKPGAEIETTVADGKIISVVKS